MDNETAPETQSGQHETPAPKSNSSRFPVGLIVGIVVIVIIAAGGYYLWGLYMEKKGMREETAPREDPIAAELEAQSSSDALSDIERDLENTNIDAIDQGLSDI